MNARVIGRRYGIRGFTLLEMLVSLIIFALVTVAASFAFSTALQANQRSQQRADQMQEVRALFAVIERDLRQAYAVTGNGNTIFVAQGNDSGTLLTFSTLAGRVQMINQPTDAQNGVLPQDIVMPQSDTVVISYSFDNERGVLSRTMTAIPNPDTMPSSDSADTVLSDRVRSISFQFIDSDGNQRTDWGFTNDQSGTTGATTPSTANTSANTTFSSMIGSVQTPDTTLPSAVQVTIELIPNDNSAPVSYTTTVAISNPQPQPAGQKPATTTTTTGGSGSNNNNNNNNNQNPPGGNNNPPGGGGPGGGGTGGGGMGGGGGTPSTPRPLPNLPGTARP